MAGAGEHFADGAAVDARVQLITAAEALEEDADASGMHDVVVEEAGEAWTKEPIKERPGQSTYSGAWTKLEPGGPSQPWRCSRTRKPKGRSIGRRPLASGREGRTAPWQGRVSTCAPRRKRSQRSPGSPSRRSPAASPARALRLLACHYYYASVYVVAVLACARMHD